MRPRRGRDPRGGRGGRGARGAPGPGGRWAGPWARTLERMRMGRRAQGGLHDARTGRVTGWEARGAEVLATVQGDGPEAFQVRFSLAPLSLAQWDSVIEAVARRPDFTARLLDGVMPYRIEDAFREARAPLFPAGGRDVRASCTCPEGGIGCRHVAALHYVLGDAVEQDPFLLFQLRGRDQEQVAHALRAATAPSAAPAGVAPDADALTADPVTFWKAGPRPNGLRADAAEPAPPGSTLRRLGPPPVGDDAEAVEAVLRRAWATAAAAAARRLRR